MQQEWCSLKTCTHVVFSRDISLMQLYSLLTPAVVFCSCGCVSCSHLLLLRLCLLQSSSAPAVVSPAVICCSCGCVSCGHLLLWLCLLRSSSAPAVMSPVAVGETKQNQLTTNYWIKYIIMYLHTGEGQRCLP